MSGIADRLVPGVLRLGAALLLLGGCAAPGGQANTSAPALKTLPTAPGTAADSTALAGIPLPPARVPETRTGSMALPVVVDANRAMDNSASVRLMYTGLAYLRPYAGGIAWVMYRFDGVYADSAPYLLSLQLATPYPQQLYVAIADFRAGCWQWQTVSTPTALANVSIPSTWQPVSGASLYVVVAAYDEDAATLDLLTLTQQVALPPPPGLSATWGTYAMRIHLSWTALAESYPGLSATGVAVDRAIDPVSGWQQLTTLPADATSYDDLQWSGFTELPYNKTVWYRLRTLNGGQSGPPGSAASGYRVLHDVGTVTASRNFADRIEVSWPVVTDAHYYYVQARLLTDGVMGDWLWEARTTYHGYTHLADLPAPNMCLESREYQYRVRAALLTGETSPGWSYSGLGIRGAPPDVALVAEPLTGLPPLRVNCDASASHDPGGGPIARYEWVWGDGQSSFTYGESGAQTFHDYGQFGDFPIVLTAVDEEEDKSAPAHASVSVPGWLHTWGTGNMEIPRGFTVGSNGNPYLAGTMLVPEACVGYILEPFPNGYSTDDCVWTFPDPGGDYPLGREMQVEKIAADGNGMLYVAGQMHLGNTHGDERSDIFLVRIDESLDGALAHVVWDCDAGHVAGLCASPDGSSYIVYTSDATDLSILSLDAQLKARWNREFSTTEPGYIDAYLADCCFDPAGNQLLVTAQLRNSPRSSVALLRVTPDGSLVRVDSWSSGQDGTGEVGKRLAVDGSGNVYIAGNISHPETGYSDALLLRFDAAGACSLALRWPGYEYGDGETTMELRGLALHDGLLDVVSIQTGSDYFDVFDPGPLLWLRLDTAGNVLHQGLMDGSSTSIGNIAAAPDGTLYLGGCMYTPLYNWNASQIAVSAAAGSTAQLTGTLTDVAGQFLAQDLQRNYFYEWARDFSGWHSWPRQSACISIPPAAQP